MWIHVIRYIGTGVSIQFIWYNTVNFIEHQNTAITARMRLLIPKV